MCLVFFLFIYFICISFLFYLLFLLKRFIVLKDSISPVLTLKRTFICGFTCTKNACEVKGFWVLGLQAAELYSNLHFTGICMLNGKQLSCSILLAFLSQSWSIVKKMAAINVTSWNTQTDVHNWRTQFSPKMMKEFL